MISSKVDQLIRKEHFDSICDAEARSTQRTITELNDIIWELIHQGDIDKLKIAEIVILASSDHSICRYTPNHTLFVSKVG